MKVYRYQATSESATDRLGRQLASVLPAGTVIALVGTLGAGKTRLVQGVAAALGVSPQDVTSPTFVLVNEYRGGRLPVYHFDTYRLADEDEFLELGPEEYFDGEGLTFVEWADRVQSCLPPSTLRIEIEVLGESSRRFVVTASDVAWEPLLERLAAGEESGS